MKNKKTKISLALVLTISLLVLPIVLAEEIPTIPADGIEINMKGDELNYGILHWLTHTHSADIFAYIPKVWQPIDGGANCLECNKLRYGCSEYQCHSAGKSCIWVEDDQTAGVCISETDNTIPIIYPDDWYLEEGYEFTPHDSASPPENGVYLIYPENSENCIPAFNNLTLGISTDKKAVCRVDIERTLSYDDMLFATDQGTYHEFNHTIFLPSSFFPSASALSTLGITIKKSTYQNTFFFRCKGANGNVNKANFLIEFCVDDGPDLTPPYITGTSFTSNPGYVAHNRTTSYFEIYTEEPAKCKWDFQNLDYDNLANEMDNCSLSKEDTYLEGGLSYGCKGSVSGIKNQYFTTYYLKCKDQPWLIGTPEEYKRNENKIPYNITLAGTEPLVIDEILINNMQSPAVIKDNTDDVKVIFKVKTSAGAEEGKSDCSYDYKSNENYIEFTSTGDILSTQPLWYPAGNGSALNYTLPIRCQDVAGNLANQTVNFSVERDLSAPEVARAYYETGNLKIITDEPAQCVYSNLKCNYGFEEGTIMVSAQSDFHHFVTWETEMNYFIKCKDVYENKPAQDECSITVKGSDYTSSP